MKRGASPINRSPSPILTKRRRPYDEAFEKDLNELIIAFSKLSLHSPKPKIETKIMVPTQEPAKVSVPEQSTEKQVSEHAMRIPLAHQVEPKRRIVVARPALDRQPRKEIKPSSQLYTQAEQKRKPSPKAMSVSPPRYLNPHYDEFIQRLETARLRNIDARLSRFILKSDLNKIIDYLLRNNAILNQIRTLQPGQALHYIKTVPDSIPDGRRRIDAFRLADLPRSIDILCDAASGELKLMVNTKSKLADHTKHTLSKKSGTYKGSGKPAWRVDIPEEEMFELVALLPNDLHKQQNYIQELQTETAISQQASRISDEVNRSELGSKFVKLGKTKINMFSRKSKQDLASFLHEVAEGKIILTQKDINDIMLGIFKGVQALQSLGKVHQDLKPGNILIDKDKSGQYRIKIIDFGLTRNEYDPNESALSTPWYESPEISQIYSASTAYYHAQFHSIKDTQYSVGRLFYLSDYQRRVVDSRPHKANDIWSLGIIYLQLQNKGRSPLFYTKQEFEALLSRTGNKEIIQQLLAHERDKRINIEKAIELQNQIMVEPSPTPSPSHVKAETTTPLLTTIWNYAYSKLMPTQHVAEVVQRRLIPSY